MNYRNISLVGRTLFALVCLGLPSCGDNASGGSMESTGGASVGGSTGVGGADATGTSGGSSAMGGNSATGGITPAGGSGGSGQGGTTTTGGQTMATGGTATGGTATGGTTTVGTGGTATGGTTTGSGGVATGGVSPSGGGGGVSTGGSAAGGVGLGGASTGGAGAGGSGGQTAGTGGAAAGTGGASNADEDGRCGLTWAAGGSDGMPALAATVTPVEDSPASGSWTFSFGRYTLVVNAQISGNIFEFSIDGNNIIEPNNGSTFWPSPQQDYTWPPPVELDGNPYAASMADNILTLQSATSSDIDLSFTKRIWVNEASAVVTLEYTMTNEGTASHAWAPWEVTRVPGGGYTFAPIGPGARTFTINEWETALPMSLIDGVNWLDYPAISSSMTNDNYIVEFDAAEGWLAHANTAGTASPLPLLLVKSFVDAQDAAMPTNQGEIQLWANGGSTSPKMIEVEEQGEAQTLAAGAQLVWTTHWALCELPDAAMLAAGNTDLVQYARAHAVAQP